MTVVVIDYGMGNLGSLSRAIETCGANVVISEDPAAAESGSGFVLPGVGAFADGMAHLQQSGWAEALRHVVVRNRPLLGICLGMQLLADRGDEGGPTAGLGIIPGAVRRMIPVAASERLPHVGWNDVHWTRDNALSHNIADGIDFYFVHSYHFIAADPATVIARSDYCGGFTAAVQRHNVWGVQFHPEKSSAGGLQLLRNFVAMSADHA